MQRSLAILFEGFPTLRERLRRTDRFANVNGLSKRQQPEFIVNLVELARRSLNVYLKKGKILWPE